MKELTSEELNKFYNDGEACDKSHFAEQRTNILLYIGNHFKKKSAAFVERNKESLSQDTKIKISENHIQVVCNRLIASIINQAPGALVVPNNDNELADIKDAELSNSVKENGEKEMNYEEKLERLANNFVVTGEAFQFYYFDPYAGELIGYKQKTTADGAPLFHAPNGEETTEAIGLMGEQFKPVQGTEPVFEGQIKMEVIHPYNVIRHRSADNLDESPFLCFRKMITPSEAKKLIANHPDKDTLENEIKATSSTPFRIFDSTAGDYIDSKDQVLIKYWLFRKCYDYPNGAFVVQIGDKKVSEGELPYGVWPAASTCFRSVSGSPRGVAIIRDLRPAQTHLNYLVSNSAHHMVALSDDRVITQMGTKLQMGQTWNGIRSFSVNGPAPVVMPGRDAGQFEAQINRQVATIYRLADMDYTLQETKIQDPWALLFSRMSEKLKHAAYAKKFERFICEGWSIYLALAKHYLDDRAIIKRVGSREAINIAEFKNMRDDGYRIKVKPVSGTLEEQLGTSLQVQQILQYVGKDLPKNVVARIINLMPFVSKESVVSDLLLTDKNIDNDILALDRGEFVPAVKDDEHDQYIKRLKSRMKEADFRTLAPNIQQMYQVRYQQHVEFQAQLAAELQAAEAGYVPTGGGLVKVNIYDDKTGQNMVMPYSSIMWLKDLMAQQGVGQEMLQQLDQATQSEILTKAQQLAAMNTNGMGQAAGMQQPTPMPYTA